jgi:ABC-type xylose transport system permease subunit
MSLNDPFGRVSRRQEYAYRQCREQLREHGIDDPEAARQRAREVGRTLLMLVLIVTLAGTVAAVLFPDQRTVIAVVAALLLLWLASSFLQTRTCLTRYLNELGAAANAAAATMKTDKNPEEKS